MILFEDADLLVVHKPSGINTHRPDVFAPEGLYEWWQRRRGGTLSVVHRLDKGTSGVLVFGKTRAANQSLTRQFTEQRIQKEYLLISDRRPTGRVCHVRSPQAETEFEWIGDLGGRHLIVARPRTGKTHQVRRHAAQAGFPILGDTEYGGANAPRLMLHAHRLTMQHPRTGETVTWQASVPEAFEETDPWVAAREFRCLLFGDQTETDAYRLVNGEGDGLPDVVVDWWGGQALVQWLSEPERPEYYDRLGADIVYAQWATRRRRTEPWRVRGEPRECVVQEHGLHYRIRFDVGMSPGLFLDQRENRWRLLRRVQPGQTVLNCFAYTCAFSVVAAKAGGIVTSVDLSRRYLDWGRENFERNQLSLDAHEFVIGDVMGTLQQGVRRGRQWDWVILDPPTFSTTKTGRAFQAERDYGALVQNAARCVRPGGWLLCSTNQRSFPVERFTQVIRDGVVAAGRRIAEEEFVTLPFDFRVA
ncbi:MAG: class I SAM-dependent methyltransferase, partial [Verrucomicrobiae bacterium]|nr:class I SAM-dependent methyltransferase [Verrucomicrobiae bacterium]